MVIERDKNNGSEAPVNSSYKLVVAQFLVTWTFFVALIAGTVLITNIDWARPQFEQILSQTIKRKVHLGHMSWNLGLNGLAIWTNKVSVREENGTLLLNSGPSEMGIAFLPLIKKGKLIIRHLQLSQPEVWAVHLSGNNWNFSDLLKPGPDIRFIEVNHGILHVRDKNVSAFAPYVFQQVELKLLFPRQHQRCPFFLALKMPGKGYTTTLQVNALGTGPYKDFRNQNYQFEVNADKLNLNDLGPLAASLTKFGGLYKLNISGNGTLAQGLQGIAKAEITDMVLPTLRLGALQADKATGSTHFMLNPNMLKWSDLLLSFGNVEIHSIGQLARKQEGKVEILSSLLDPTKLTGEAEFELQVHGNGLNPQLSAAVKSSGLVTAELIENSPLKYFPWLSALLSQSSSKMNGELKIAHDERIDLPGAEFTAGGSPIHIKGFWDKQNENAELKFSGQKIDLGTLAKHCASSKEISQFIVKNTGLTSASNLSLQGHVDLSGTLSGQENAHNIKILAALRNCAFSLKDKHLSAQQINGKIEISNSAIQLTKVTGQLGQGKFELAGLIPLGKNPQSNVVLNASNIDLDDLNTALQVLKVQVPILSQHQLYGQVRQLSLKFGGTAQSPQFSLMMVPNDLYYQAVGVIRPLHATSGTVTYMSDELVLKDVTLGGHNNQLLTSLDIANLSGSCDLKRVKVKSTGIELGDLHFYLASALMPPALRKEYTEFVTRYQLSNAHGKAYGKLLWQAKQNNDFDLDAAIGLNNTAIKVGSYGWPLEHVSGIFAASGNELLVQDVTGAVGGNKFTMNGHVLNYRGTNPRWQTEFRARIHPERALKLIPGLADQFGGKITSAKPLALRAIIAGDLQSGTIIFGVRADPDSHVKLSTPFGVIAQPASKAIVLDGSLALETGAGGTAQLNNVNLVVGTSLLQGRGKYTWFDPKTNKQPLLECDIEAPNPVSAETVVAILNPQGKAPGVSGTISGEVSTAGPINRLTSRGCLNFDHLTLPQFDLFEANGKVESPGWSFDGSDLSKAAITGSQTKLHIDSAKIGSLETKALDAHIVFESSSNDQPSQKIVLKDGHAEVAGGNVQMAGWADLINNRIHLKADLSRVEAGEVVSQMMQHPGEISGWADASITLDSKGSDYKQLTRNLDGDIKLTVTSGKVARFGPLQEKLTQANLLQNGILGFNLNNLVQSVVPMRTGEFKELETSASIAKGVVSIDQLKFNGDDMRLRAAGKVNLLINTIDLDVAGNIPRVSTSMLSSAMGDASRGLSIQRLINLLTLHKLENLPPLPILGDIADDRPRAFTFHVTARTDSSHLIAQSIQKSFHWLPSHPNASAHPVPGLILK